MLNKYIALLVALDDDKSEMYIAIDIETMDDVPENNSKDIMKILSIYNSSENTYDAIDVFGIVHNGFFDQWEEIDNYVLEEEI